MLFAAAACSAAAVAALLAASRTEFSSAGPSLCESSAGGCVSSLHVSAGRVATCLVACNVTEALFLNIQTLEILESFLLYNGVHHCDGK